MPGESGFSGYRSGPRFALGGGTRSPGCGGRGDSYGGFPEWEDLDPSRLPPVLILHGDADRNVPVQQAYDLEQILVAAEVPYEMHIYAGAGHGFRGADRDDAVKRTVDFFDTHLKAHDRVDDTFPRGRAGAVKEDVM